MNKDHKVIKIGNKKVAVGLFWSLIESNTVGGRKKKAESLVKSKHLTYGILKDNPEKNDALLCLTSEENKGSYIGGYLVAEKIKDAAFFTQINDDEDNEKLFWLCAIGKTGRVISGFDCIVEENELAQRISDLEALYIDLKIYAPQEHFRVFPDYEILPLELKSLTKVEEIDRFYGKDLKKRVNVPLLIASISAFSIASYMAYEYIYKENPIVEEISNGSLYEEIYGKERKIINDKKKLNNKKTLNQEEYDALASRQLGEIFDRQFYSKKEIIQNIDTMTKTLPQYLVEWELQQISYNKNSFLFLYQRIPESSGTYNQMMIELDKTLEKQGLKYEFLGANPEFTVAQFRINFQSEKENEYLNKKTNEQTRVNGIIDPTKNNFLEIKKIKKEIDGFLNDAENLSFIDKRWGDNPREIKESITSRVALINGELNKISKIHKREIEIEKKIQKEQLSKENRYDNYYNTFLNKAQLNQDYGISTPVQISVLPIIEQEKTQSKSKKRRGKAKKEELKNLIKVYQFGISSKEYSLGLDQAEEAMNIIDNKSVIYFNLDYDIKTNKWEIRGNMYEEGN